jgi:hypothetical protein
MCPSEVMLILLIIVAGVAASFMFYKQKESKEGFADLPTPEVKPDIPNITFCPFNSTAVIMKSGETLCCDGKSSKRYGCLTKTVCSLSNSQGKNYKSCSETYAEYIKKMSSEKCFPKMPKYYEKRDSTNKEAILERGCYNGPTKFDRYEPVRSNQPKCIIVNSQKESEFNTQSCENQIDLQAVKRVLPNTQVKFISFNKAAPPLLQVSFPVKQQMFGAEVEMPVNTYTMKSIARFWKYTWPDAHKYNFENLTAEQLGAFIYEIRLDILQNKLAPTTKNVYKNYFFTYVLRAKTNR